MPDMTPFNPDPETLLAHQGPMRALARSLLRDEHKAEDVVGEAMLRALETPPKSAGALRAWLAKVVRRLALRSAQQDRQRGAREVRAARSEGVLEGVDASLDAQTEVLQALKALPEPYRSALHKRYFEDLQPRHIASEEGAPLPTVKARLRRGLDLRAELDRRSDGDRQRWASALFPFAQLGGEQGSIGFVLVSLAAAALAMMAGSAWQLASGAMSGGASGAPAGSGANAVAVAPVESAAGGVRGALKEQGGAARRRGGAAGTGSGPGEEPAGRSREAGEREPLVPERSRAARVLSIRMRTRTGLALMPAVEDVRLTDAEGRSFAPELGADGRSFEFEDLLPNRYELRIEDPRFETVVRRDLAAGGEHCIELEGNAGALVEAVDEHGRPVADVRASLELSPALAAGLGGAQNEGATGLGGGGSAPWRSAALEVEPESAGHAVRGLLPGLPCALRLEAEGRAPVRIELEALMPGEKRRLSARFASGALAARAF